MKEVYLKLVLVSTLCLCSHLVSAQFPSVCTDSLEVLNSAECCPIPEGYTEQCGGEGRGVCGAVIANDEGDFTPSYTIYEFDDRMAWPSRFFNRTCQCEYPFWGPSCTDCWWGYYGDECTETRMNIRKNIKSLSSEALLNFQTYLNWLKGNISDHSVMVTTLSGMKVGDEYVSNRFVHTNRYDYWVWMHYYGNMPTLYYAEDKGKLFREDMMWNHHGANFLPWHRAFILYIEREIQRISGDDSFAMPFWEWEGLGTTCDVCTPEYMGASDENGALISEHFHKWGHVCSESATYDLTDYDICDPTKHNNQIARFPSNDIEQELPTVSDLTFTLSIPNYDTPNFDVYSNCSFRNVLGGNGNTSSGDAMYIEGITPRRYMHGQVHRFLGGVMNDIPSSVSDPIFLIHHTYLDHVWEKWFRRWNADETFYPIRGATIGHNRHTFMVPYFPAWQNIEAFKRTTAFGYDYELLLQNGYAVGEELVADDLLEHASCGIRTSSHYFD